MGFLSPSLPPRPFGFSFQPPSYITVSERDINTNITQFTEQEMKNTQSFLTCSETLGMSTVRLSSRQNTTLVQTEISAGWRCEPVDFDANTSGDQDSLKAPSYLVERASHRAEDMDEWDVPQMKKEVESLKYQLAFKREKSSKTVTDLVKWIEDGVPEDPFLNPELMKSNPWVEKGKCVLL
ncbi:hypothetical protein NQZ68_038945 [Dissostichus eleginoides]|nr:hypothetical protein NQZ68_038945 [Dissostichus eleginoides]